MGLTASLGGPVRVPVGCPTCSGDEVSIINLKVESSLETKTLQPEDLVGRMVGRMIR